MANLYQPNPAIFTSINEIYLSIIITFEDQLFLVMKRIKVVLDRKGIKHTWLTEQLIKS
jgi:hypothetical protein